MEINAYIDHTLLKPTAMDWELVKLCEEALQYRFAAVCVPPSYVSLAAEYCSGSKVKVATVIGFPFGYSVLAAKEAEVREALAGGADELDMVINLIHLRNGDWSKLENEAWSILAITKPAGKILKLIIESGMLTDEEIIRCCRIYGGLGVDFVKTSTGYAEKGATAEAVQLMRRSLPSSVRVKASGGIKTREQAMTMIEAGADRLGCSAGVAIVTGATANNSGY